MTYFPIRISRFLCVFLCFYIADDKRLYTWGWGKYGQLGHGDVQSRDSPKLVDFFLQNRLDVLDVTCGDWSTAAYTCPSPEPMPR